MYESGVFVRASVKTAHWYRTEWNYLWIKRF